MCLQSCQKWHFQKISKMADWSSDLLFDDKVATGITSKRLNFLHASSSKVTAWFSNPWEVTQPGQGSYNC